MGSNHTRLGPKISIRRNLGISDPVKGSSLLLGKDVLRRRRQTEHHAFMSRYDGVVARRSGDVSRQLPSKELDATSRVRTRQGGARRATAIRWAGDAEVKWPDGAAPIAIRRGTRLVLDAGQVEKMIASGKSPVVSFQVWQPGMTDKTASSSDVAAWIRRENIRVEGSLFEMGGQLVRFRDRRGPFGPNNACVEFDLFGKESSAAFLKNGEHEVRLTAGGKLVGALKVEIAGSLRHRVSAAKRSTTIANVSGVNVELPDGVAFERSGRTGVLELGQRLKLGAADLERMLRDGKRLELSFDCEVPRGVANGRESDALVEWLKKERVGVVSSLFECRHQPMRIVSQGTTSFGENGVRVAFNLLDPANFGEFVRSGVHEVRLVAGGKEVGRFTVELDGSFVNV